MNNNPNTPFLWDNLNQKKEKQLSLSPIYRYKNMQVLSWIQNNTGRLLNIGVGNGLLERMIQKHKPNMELFGIDISTRSIKKLARNNLGSFFVASITKIPFKNNMFSYVLVLDVIEHLLPDELNKGLNEILRVLDKRGKVIVSVPINEGVQDYKNNRHVNHFDLQKLVDVFSRHGFTLTKSKYFVAFPKYYILKNLINSLFKIRQGNLLLAEFIKKMKILFLARFVHPHIGGVERHINATSSKLHALGYTVKTISEKDIKQPRIKFIGLLYIWYWFIKNRKEVLGADIIHIHDVFIWYLPLRILYPRKKVYTTFHGWEGKFPLPMWAILNKRIAWKLSAGTIAVGNYINKWYGIRADFVTYGGVNKVQSNTKIKNTIIWLGRQDEDTGINEFHKWLIVNGQRLTVKYITNDPNPEKYLKKSEYCVPSGYLSYLEAWNAGCKIITFADNPLKEDYWKEIKKIKKIPSWSEVTELYLKIWRL